MSSHTGAHVHVFFEPRYLVSLKRTIRRVNFDLYKFSCLKRQDIRRILMRDMYVVEYDKPLWNKELCKREPVESRDEYYSVLATEVGTNEYRGS